MLRPNPLESFFNSIRLTSVKAGPFPGDFAGDLAGDLAGDFAGNFAGDFEASAMLGAKLLTGDLAGLI